MSTQSFRFDTEDISDSEFQSFSQKSSQSQFRADDDTDEDYEDESQEIHSSDNFSSQEFSQVNLFLIHMVSPTYQTVVNFNSL